MKAPASNRVVWAALVGNILVAATKLAAALISGSSAMMAEAVHSGVDTGNELLLLWGIRRARQPADAEFQFGHGRELYFWSFVVALLVFAIGGCVAVWQGVRHWLAPEPLSDPWLIYGVLALSALFEGTTWWISLRAFRSACGRITIWEGIRRSKDPPKFMVLVEDSAALAGILVAAIGTWAASATGDPRFDAGASIVIGALLGLVAITLARETKGLLIGERADDSLVADVMAIIAGFEEVEHANGMLSVQLAPDQVIAIASIAFADHLRTPRIEALVEEIEAAVLEKRPEIGRLFVKPQKPEAYHAAAKLRLEVGPGDLASALADDRAEHSGSAR